MDSLSAAWYSCFENTFQIGEEPTGQEVILKPAERLMKCELTVGSERSQACWCFLDIAHFVKVLVCFQVHLPAPGGR